MKNTEEMHELLVLEKADELAFRIYQETKSFPEEEFFGLTQQLRWLALKVPINIIEGINRKERKELKLRLKESLGKIVEIRYLLDFSLKMKYLSTASYQEISQIYSQTDNLLWRFYNAF